MARPQTERILQHLRRLAGSEAAAGSSDAELLRHFLDERDEAAFTALVQRHGAMVWQVRLAALGQREDAEDVFQATFVVLARKAGSVRKPESLACWLHGVAFCLARKVRERNLRRRTNAGAALDQLPARPMEDLTWRELRQVLHEELALLPEKNRLPILLCHLEGRTQDEAAQALGWSLGRLRGRLLRGRELLRRRLVRRGLAPSVPLLAAALFPGEAGAAPPELLVSALGKSIAALARPEAPGASGPLALAERFLRESALVWKKVAVTCAVALLPLLGVLGLLVQLPTAVPGSPQRADKAPAEKPAPVQDGKGERQVLKELFGDPLPPGARLRLGTTRFRHVGDVYCLAFTADGKTLASCAWGTRDVRLWEVATARELPPLYSHGNDVGCIAISRDGRTLASSAYFEKVRVFDLAARKELRTFPVSGNWVALAPDGKTVAFLNPDRVVSVCDVASGRELHRLKGHKGEPCRFAFSPDGKALATADEAGEVRLWDVVSGKAVHAWAHRGPASSVTFSPDGKAVAAGYRHNVVWVWDAATGKELAKLELPNNSGNAVTFSPDGKLLAVGGHYIGLWDTATWKECARFEDYANVTALAFSPDGKTLASGNHCGTVRLWDVDARKELRPLTSHQGAVRTLAFTPEGGALVTGGRDDTVRLWDPTTGKELRRICAHQYGSWSIAVSPDGKRVASAGSSPARIWDATDGKELHVLHGGILAVAFAPDGKTVVTGSDRGGVRFWDAATGRERATGSAPAHFPHSFAFAPDGRVLASAGEAPGEPDAAVHLWDTASGKKLRSLPAPKNGIKVVAWSPDGRTLAVASDGNYLAEANVRDIVLWDVQTGSELRRLKGHKERVYAVAFSPDGRTLASAGGYEKETVRLWEVDTGVQRLGLGKAQIWVRCLAFSPDGRTLATGAEDSTVLLWDLPAKLRRPGPQDEKQLVALWADLAGGDGAKAYSAVWTLAGAPEQAVAFLKQRLRPVAREDVAVAERLVRDLDDNAFKVREKAQRALRELGDVAVPALEKALAGGPTLEARRRLEKLLHELERADFSRTRQKLRAVEALEYAGTAAARELLGALTRGAPEARLTREAGASLGRLTRRDARSGPGRNGGGLRQRP